MADNNSPVTTNVMRLPGMQLGEVGLAGEDKPGPSVRAVAIPVWKYIGVEILTAFLTNFFGLFAADATGAVELAPPGDAFAHMYRIAGIALAPTTLMLAKELYDYLQKIRAASR